MVSILPGLYWLETEDVQCRDSVSKKNHTPGQQMDIGQRRRPGSHPEGEQADIVLFLRSPMNFFHPRGGGGMTPTIAHRRTVKAGHPDLSVSARHRFPSSAGRDSLDGVHMFIYAYDQHGGKEDGGGEGSTGKRCNRPGLEETTLHRLDRG